MGGLRDGDRGSGGRRRHHDRRHAAEQHPADHRRGRPRGQAARRRGAAVRRRRVLGRRRAGQPRSSSPLHDAGVVGFKCFLLPSGVDEFPPLDRDGLHDAMATIAGFGGLLIAHAEDEHDIGAAHGRRYATFSPRVPTRPRRARSRRCSSRPAARVVAPTSCTCRVPPALPLIAAAKAEGLPVTVETCPHYLTFAAERGARRRDPVQVLPADPRRRQSRGALGRAGRRHDRSGRVRPLAVHRPATSASTPATSAPRGAGSRRCSSGCPRCGRPRATAASR